MDEGINGEVTYKVEPANSVDPETFYIDPVDGKLRLLREFLDVPASNNFEKSNRTEPFHLTVEAQDGSVTGQRFNRTHCYVSLIRPINRFVLVLQNTPMTNVVEQQEDYRRSLQNATDHVVIIEKIEAKRIDTITNGQLTVQQQSTDVTFVLALPTAPFTLRQNNDPTVGITSANNVNIATIKIIIENQRGVVVETVRKPFNQSLFVVQPPLKAKSYNWWVDDPWSALVALAAIIILLAVVCIIVIAFSHSRYMKFIQQYRAYQSTYDNPDFAEPPGFLREYETQSLNMYVPPEAVPDYGEVRMTLDEAGGVGVTEVTHTIG